MQKKPTLGFRFSLRLLMFCVGVTAIAMGLWYHMERQPIRVRDTLNVHMADRLAAGGYVGLWRDPGNGRPVPIVNRIKPSKVEILDTDRSQPDTLYCRVDFWLDVAGEERRLVKEALRERANRQKGGRRTVLVMYWGN